MGEARSRLRRGISRWASSEDQEARDLQESFASRSTVHIAEAPDR